MRQAILPTCFLSALLICVVGCGNTIQQRTEASDVQGKVTIAGIVSPKDLTISFQPQQNSLPGVAKIAPDGSFTVKLTPGNYSYYFNDEANAAVPAYKKIPPAYHSASADRVIAVSSGSPIVIDVK